MVDARRWGSVERGAFRFFFVYLPLWFLPFPIGAHVFPSAGDAYQHLWETIVLWVGRRVLHVGYTISTVETGSGDRTYDYVLAFCYLVLAATVALVWSIADRRRADYTRLYDGLRVYLRYGLAMVMLGYGFSKVFKVQFPSLQPISLMTTYGESSPAGLLWNFMGYSVGYNIFTGAGEVIGGALLFFRRTTTLGALLLLAIMSNVLMLNLCYDVPVKLYSAHLCLVILFLLWPDRGRLARFLARSRAVQAPAPRPPLPARWMEVARLAVKATFVVLLVAWSAESRLKRLRDELSAQPHPLSAVYDVEEHVRAGAPSPLAKGSKSWGRVIITSYGKRLFIGVKKMNDEEVFFRAKDTPDTGALELSTRAGGSWTMTYARPDADHLVLSGTVMDEAHVVRLKKVDLSKLELTSRGFHWISEVPYIR